MCYNIIGDMMNKEYIVKKKLWVILLETLIDALIVSTILYYCFGKYNTNITNLLNNIKENNMEFQITGILFPLILITIGIIKYSIYTVFNSNESDTKKSKKKKK